MTASSKKSRPAPRETTSSFPPLIGRWDRPLTAGLLIWTFASLVYPLYDTDFWWHLKTGEMILERGQVPVIDWFTFTDAEQPWIDLHWGFQLLITFLYRIGGINLVILTKATVITAAVGVAWFAAGRELPAWLKFPFWGMAVVAISGRGYERPEMLSQLFLALWLLIAFRVERQPRLIWFLPLVQLVWTNCHALFVLGLVIGGAYTLDSIAREFSQGRWGLERPAPRPSARAMIWSGGLVALACFANPYFEDGALFPLTLYRKFTVEQEFYSYRIGEFQQPIRWAQQYGLKNIYLLAELGLWLATATSFLARFLCSRKWSVLRLVLFIAFSHLAWEASRNTNIFSLVSAVVLSANLADLLKEWEWRPSAQAATRLEWGAMASVVLLMGMVVTGIWNRIGEGNKPFRLGESEKWFIHDAAKFAGQEGFPHRAFVANNGQAAVYTYHNAPDRLVFMDGRLEVCSMNTFKIYEEILARMAAADPGWQSLFTAEGGELPVVVLDSRSQTSREAINGLNATPGWKLVFADETAAVFLDIATADKLELPPVDPTPLMYPPGMERPRLEK